MRASKRGRDRKIVREREREREREERERERERENRCLFAYAFISDGT